MPVGCAAEGDEGVAEPDAPIPDKVGAEVHLTPKERKLLTGLECDMCKAIVQEMHVEVAKHGMTKKGWGSESTVWETSNAICLGILQKYRINLPAKTLERKSEEEDDDEHIAKSGVDPQGYMRALIVLKMGCQGWVDDYGGDTSGFIFKAVREGMNSPAVAAQDFCTRQALQCGKEKKARKKAQKEQERQRSQRRQELRAEEDKEEQKRKKANPLDSIPEDSQAGLTRMLEIARDDPLHYFEDSARQRIRKAQAELRCDVCRAAIESVHMEVANRPKSRRREHDILPLMEGACDGGPDLSLPNYFGVEPPPLPPSWTDRYRPQLKKKTGRYGLGRFSKKAAKARRKWRELTATGQQKPPPQEEGEEDLMLTLSCKDALEPEGMAEALFHRMAQCEAAEPTVPGCEGQALASGAASVVCKDAAGALCKFEGAGGALPSPPAGKDEL